MAIRAIAPQAICPPMCCNLCGRQQLLRAGGASRPADFPGFERVFFSGPIRGTVGVSADCEIRKMKKSEKREISEISQQVETGQDDKLL